MRDYYQEHEKELSDFVNREVIYCVSSLVSRLAETVLVDEVLDIFQGAPSYGEWHCPFCQHDWEEEPPEPRKYGDPVFVECPECNEDVDDEYFSPSEYREIYEHWIVTDWLAERLAEKGEAICKDFYGLTIWGRSCTGQAIALDGVISEIHQDLHATV